MYCKIRADGKHKRGAESHHLTINQIIVLSTDTIWLNFQDNFGVNTINILVVHHAYILRIIFFFCFLFVNLFLVLIFSVWKNMSNTYQMHSENITKNDFVQFLNFTHVRKLNVGYRVTTRTSVDQ